ncbi:MAG: hypothetical protein ISS35_00355 [Kiritimatiellae bacterium]|nr:hypothetical protein [Kiritimatiellia bacterium]
MPTNKHSAMRFRQFGRTCQLRIENAQDLHHVLNLDDALWVATSVPSPAFADTGDLVAVMDRDGSGRITSDELRAAIAWFLNSVNNPEDVTTGEECLALENINQDSPDGSALLSSAEYILKAQGKADAKKITLQEVAEFLDKLTEQPLNGDGIVVPDAANNDALIVFLRDAVACVNAMTDASGKRGVNRSQLDEFRSALEDYRNWESETEASDNTTLLPLGDQTFSAYTLLQEHMDKVQAFFTFHEARHFADEVTQVPKKEPDADFNINATRDVVSRLTYQPIAKPIEEDSLPLSGHLVNPLYREWLEAVRTRIVIPLLGSEKRHITPSDWSTITNAFAPVATYIDLKKDAKVGGITAETRKQYLGGDLFQQAETLAQQDADVAAVRMGAQRLKQLLLYQKHLLRVANNFVSFSELYTPEQAAIFEKGAAVIDGRWFGLALEVTDMTTHSGTAKASGIFTCYLDVSNPDGTRKMTVAIPATSGSKGNLRVGKRGIFFDNARQEYDAKIVKIIDNPISFREALAAPFVRLWNFVLGKIEAISATTENDLQKQTGALLAAPPAAKQTPTGSGVPGGPAALLVGLSVSAAAVGSSLAFIAKTFAAMSWFKLLGGLSTAALIVIMPSSLIAFLKLRRQDLSSLLEGCGWAINTRMRLSRAQRYQFTRRPHYPTHAIGLPVRRGLLSCLVTAAILTALGLIYLGITALRSG